MEIENVFTDKPNLKISSQIQQTGPFGLAYFLVYEK